MCGCVNTPRVCGVIERECGFDNVLENWTAMRWLVNTVKYGFGE